LAPRRAKRPHQNSPKKVLCPFDEGNEGMTPPELLRVGEGQPDKKGWQIRVVPNLYQITSPHEVIIHSPDHKKDIADLPLSHVQEIFLVFQSRFNALKKEGYPLIFNNSGAEAGASLPHPHSQIAVIPAHVGISSPLAQKPHNIALKGKSLVAFCPDFSVWPYETWIEPFPRGKNFADVDEEQLRELAKMTQQVLQSLLAAHPKLSYNFYIYPGDDWYLRIMGRNLIKAGFELGSGIQVNTIDPADVVKILS
ncbi:MAG TPA: hypothetical protein VFK94_02015, partial [Patescibacteria group bacterium]|nr:hypothetical protein [Patescibacteria group bacterium]